MSSMKFLSRTVLMFLLVSSISARHFDLCSLAREMDRLGVPRNELSHWVCIAQYESTYNTQAVGPPNSDGSRDYGIFQINSRYWCQGEGQSSNGCGVQCNQLLADNIRLSVACARQIQRTQGWSAWSVYNPRCAGRLPNTNACF